MIVESKKGKTRSVKRHWEIVKDNLQKAGWNCGCISSTDHDRRQFWVVAAERSGAGRFIVRSDEVLTAFLELESAIRQVNGLRLSVKHQKEAVTKDDERVSFQPNGSCDSH